MASSNPKIYNTLSNKKEVLRPLRGKKINLFVCGPTVYDLSHIGHARTYIIFDCFSKYLKHFGFRVFYLQNITNIDDKIIARAREKKVLPKDLAEVFSKEYFKEMKKLGITSVTKYAKATDYIKEIINQIKRLLDKSYAYQLDDGIYYNIDKFKNYGKLSGRTALQAEDAVSRIDYSRHKKNRGDFCLWKFSTQEEPSWPSQFGRGRPGWHIEDTAITEKLFGTKYDIHGGARDLIFPHHEAEIAQMEAISGKRPMVKYWMHTGFLTSKGQKMSKSLNNFITINDFLKRYSFRYLRFWIAKNLWRAPIDYSESAIIEAKSSIERIEEFIRKIHLVKSSRSEVSRKAGQFNRVKKLKQDFYRNLKDDFNTPKAFAVIFNFIKKTNKLLENNTVSKKQADETRAPNLGARPSTKNDFSAQVYKFFEEINKIFDIIDFKKLKQSNIPNEVKKLLKERESQRNLGNWKKSDEIRVEIEKYGYEIEDTKDGTVVKKK